MVKGSVKFIAVAFLVLSASLTSRAQTGQETSSVATQALDQQTQPAQPPRTLELEEAIRTALTQHPNLRQAREAILAAQARTGQSRSGYFPQISASGFAKQGLSGSSGALGLRGLVTSPLFRDIGASSAVFLNLYDFGRTAHQVKASQWAAVSLEHALEVEKAFVTLEVQRAYYTALEEQRLIEVSEKKLSDRQLIARQATAFYKAQLKSKLDLTLAEVGVANANLDLVQVRDRLRTAFADLNHAMGVEGESSYTLVEPKIVLSRPASLDSLLEEGQRRRPELLAFDAQIKADEEIVARSQKNRWPKLMALFSSGWVRFSDLSPGKLMLGAFGLDLPVFTGGRIENEILEAKANLAQTRAARERIGQDIRFQVQRAHNELLSAIESVRANEQLITQAREALRLAQVRYRVQLGSFVELTSAEAAASSAEAQYAQALYRYKIAEGLLDYATGRR
ncbi:MAG: TolC family protein [Blastocatellia bacterium]|nr:TolC family protein [Blastocatellia bacterium]